MQAVVKTDPAPGHAVVRDWPDPRVGDSDVLIEVKRAGLCGTDVALYDWAHSVSVGYRPRLPQVMGHEFAGVVVETGAGVTGVRAGDHVVGCPHRTCGSCRFCLGGRSVLCRERRVLGLDTQGVLAELAVLPASNVFRVPDGTSWDAAALAEPFTVAVHALERVPVRPGDVAVVVGAGSVGCCLLVALTLTPAAGVVVVGLDADADQLALAESMGATVVRADVEDPWPAVAELTDGDGAGVAFEAAGHPEAVRTAIRLTRSGGTTGLVGLPHDPVELDTAALAFTERDVRGVRAYELSTWQRIPGLLRRAAADLQRLATHRMPLTDFDRAVDLLRRREALKVLLAPSDHEPRRTMSDE